VLLLLLLLQLLQLLYQFLSYDA